MRRIRDPESYTTPAAVAAWLRKIAGGVERRSGFIKANLDVSFATDAEIERAAELQRKREERKKR